MSKGIELMDRKLEGKVVVGIDTHADTHWLCVLDERYRVALSCEFLSTPDGFEGTCSYGAGLTDALMACGSKVLEVFNKKKDRRRRRGEGKDDETDADGTSIPKLRGGRLDELRSLLVARKRLCVLRARGSCGHAFAYQDSPRRCSQ